MKVSKVVSILRRTKIFGGVHDDALNVLAFNGRQSSHEAGEVLLKVGTSSGRALLVLSGEIEVDTGTHVPAVVGGPAAMVGELALLADREASVNVRSLSACEILQIDRDLFSRLVAEFPEIAATLKQQLSQRFEALRHDLAGLEAHLRLEPVSATSRQIPPSREYGQKGAPNPEPHR